MAFVFVKDDLIATSKVIMRFAKEHEALAVRGGFLSDRVLAPADIKLISKLISRQALYQQVASVLNAPVGKLAMSVESDHDKTCLCFERGARQEEITKSYSLKRMYGN